MDLAPAGGNAALAQVARRFEAQALGALLKPVFGEAPKGLLSGGTAEQQWRPMLVEQHARAWAGRGGIGIAPAVYSELLRAQAAQQGAAPSFPARPTTSQHLPPQGTRP
ncbi:rod-binding protein [Muricoccus vinaceus]|uniref:Rod-binding protein n=1 Tax=Muricoccus vinaceus TaxID=424704 RepID=A0ABV6IMX3_9PROT